MGADCKDRRSALGGPGLRLDHAERALPHLPWSALDGDSLSDMPL